MSDPQRQRPPAVFADRDGTLIEEVGYLTELERLRLLPGVGAAVARLNAADIPLVVITNQSAVARGLVHHTFVDAAARRLATLLAAEGAHLDGHYFCPHHPEGQSPFDIVCNCRKPGHALIERACEELDIAPAGAVMIGDKVSDLNTGAVLGLVPVLVRTGYGRETERHLPPDFAARGGQIYDDFPAAVAAWLDR